MDSLNLVIPPSVHSFYKPYFIACVVLAMVLVSCKKDSSPPTEPPVEPPPIEEPPLPNVPEASDGEVVVRVLLDGEPIADAIVLQGGAIKHEKTDEAGYAVVPVHPHAENNITIVASHPDARSYWAEIPASGSDEVVEIELFRFSLMDNRAYRFQDPGTPDNSNTTAQCGHCHREIMNDWYSSIHRTAASNSWVQDLYAGTASHFDTQALCEAQGGRWLSGLEPGTRDPVEKCYLGSGALPTLNTNCGDDTSCDSTATEYGNCADCHAPGINLGIGGRDLLGAVDIEFDAGVHCDVCHRVNAVNLDSVEPGVSGRLSLVRPTEASPTPTLGDYLPLTFGPRYDVPNPRMGGVQRDHYQNGELCSGCHEYEQSNLVPGASIDVARWPEGRIPVHSTWSELQAGPFAGKVICNNCHMPPNPTEGNSIAIQQYDPLVESMSTGFLRQPGTVLHHQWVGPRFEGQRMLQLAAQVEITSSQTDQLLTAQVKVKNVGPGHAIPTGEPLRSIVLKVTALCGEQLLTSSGGHVVPDFGGYEEISENASNWDTWPNAQVGDIVRVVTISESYHDYLGFGPFGDGQFSAAQKGMPVELGAGESTIVSVNASGQVEFDTPLPAGNRAYRVRPNPEGQAWQGAGAPGFGFARVMVGVNGERMVPHFAAIDVASDNRLLPQSEWTSTHQFTSTCDTPKIHAELLYRRFPYSVAKNKSGSWVEETMVEVTR